MISLVFYFFVGVGVVLGLWTLIRARMAPAAAADVLIFRALLWSDETDATTINTSIASFYKKPLSLVTLYPTLRRMEDAGFLVSYELPDMTGARGGRPRVMYRFTPAGRLAAQRAAQAGWP